jgi:hypothetical protein
MLTPRHYWMNCAMLLHAIAVPTDLQLHVHASLHSLFKHSHLTSTSSASALKSKQNGLAVSGDSSNFYSRCGDTISLHHHHCVLIANQVASGYAIFLEKIANMFEVMASVLPPYHQIYTICKRRMGNSQVGAGDERLTTLMSYAFADIVGMCLDIYRIFLRNGQSKCQLCKLQDQDRTSRRQ